MRVLALLAVAACDRVLSLDPITALPPRITGTFEELYATNQADGTPMVGKYVPPVIAASVTLDDGTAPAVEYRDDGTFAFPIEHAGQTYRIAIQTPDGSLDYTSDAGQLQLALRLGARPSVERTPVTMPTLLAFDLAGKATSTSEIWIASTGQWSFTGTVFETGMFDFDWRTANAFATPIGLLDASDYNDRLFAVEVDTSATNYSILQAFELPIDLVDGAMTPISGTLAPVATQSCLAITTQLADQDAGWTAIAPDSTFDYSFVQVAAIASYELATSASILVSQIVDYNSAKNATVQPSFGVPFEGSVLIAGGGILRTRQIALPGSTTPFTGYLASVTFVPAPTGTACAPIAATTAAIALPSDPVVGGVAITGDETVVPLPASGPLSISWSDITPGAADYHNIQLYELKDVSGYTVPHFVDGTITAATSVAFDSTQLASGHAYILHIGDVLGVPGASSGDFAHVSYPFGNTSMWSHYFTLQ